MATQTQQNLYLKLARIYTNSVLRGMDVTIDTETLADILTYIDKQSTKTDAVFTAPDDEVNLVALLKGE